MIIPCSEEDTWTKINVCAIWFLALNWPGKQPRKLFECHNYTFFFLYPSPISESEKGGHWLFQPSCSWSRSIHVYLRKQENTWGDTSYSLVTAASFLPHWGCGSHFSSQKKRPEPHRVADPVFRMNQVWNHLHLDFSLCVISNFNKLSSQCLLSIYNVFSTVLGTLKISMKKDHCSHEARF